ncbi:MAG TPA: ASKHA domain-containing protein [Candidatus Limnocylindrales bacterium]
MAPTGEPLVIFTPSGRRARVPLGTNLLDTARGLGVDIDSVCGGRGICGRCQVRQSIGTFAKHGITSSADHLAEPGEAEERYRAEKGLAPDRRLSCLTSVCGDVVIDVPPESQVHRQVVRKGIDVRTFKIDPVVSLHYVEVERPTLASPSGDLARLLAALEREWEVHEAVADLAVVRALQPALEKGGYAVTVALHERREVIAIWPGFRDKAYGVAIDVGSTTIAGHLADLADGRVLASNGVMNPQIRFGEDLMSRVSYAMMHPDGAAEMTRAVRGALDGLVSGLAAAAGIPIDAVLALTIVGNPIMHHLVLGIDPIPLGSAPFALATDRAVATTAHELEISANAGARVYVLPCIAGHVGADTAGVILAEEPQRATRMELVVDVGTNAEIVLGNRDGLLAASSPTGPAFEGAQISAGQRAAPGAIERVRIDRQTLEPRFRVIGVDAWSDDPAFARRVRKTGVTGICGSGIVEVIAELYLAGVITPDGIVDGSLAERTCRIVPDGRTFSYVLYDPAEHATPSSNGRAAGPDGQEPGPDVHASPEPTARILVTQNDVRAVQLAKAALYAGTRLLMDHAGIDHVDDVRLAGAFGSQIDPFHALVLGLVPDCDLDHVKPAGNAAGTGALIALLSKKARNEIEAVVRSVEKVETAVEPRFQEHFVDAMAFPHRIAPYPNLERIVTLPRAARPGEGQPGRARRTNRRNMAAGEAARAAQGAAQAAVEATETAVAAKEDR